MPGTGTTGRTSGAGRVTLTRTGGGAGPDWGVYALMYATRPLKGGRTEAVLGYCPPDAPLLDPNWGLHQTRPYGPTGCARRPLGDYASAANSPRGSSESPAAYGQRMACYLLRTAVSSRHQMSLPHIVDLPWADWQIHTEQRVVLRPDREHPDRGWAGHHAVRVGRLLALAPKRA